MADKVVPSWARWALFLALALPVAGYVFLKDYSREQSFVANAQIQVVQLPLLYGPNPIACLNEALRIRVEGKMGTVVTRSPQCANPTEVSYLSVFILSGLLLILSLYGFLSPEQIASKWPTRWKVFDENNTSAKDTAPDKHRQDGES